MNRQKRTFTTAVYERICKKAKDFLSETMTPVTNCGTGAAAYEFIIIARQSRSKQSEFILSGILSVANNKMTVEGVSRMMLDAEIGKLVSYEYDEKHPIPFLAQIPKFFLPSLA
jgi:hypothetical protein